MQVHHLLDQRCIISFGDAAYGVLCIRIQFSITRGTDYIITKRQHRRAFPSVHCRWRTPFGKEKKVLFYKKAFIFSQHVWRVTGSLHAGSFKTSPKGMAALLWLIRWLFLRISAHSLYQRNLLTEGFHFGGGTYMRYVALLFFIQNTFSRRLSRTTNAPTLFKILLKKDLWIANQNPGTGRINCPDIGRSCTSREGIDHFRGGYSIPGDKP